MLRDITIGQHFPGNSVVHRCDPRLKIIATIAYIIVLFMRPTRWALRFRWRCWPCCTKWRRFPSS